MSCIWTRLVVRGSRIVFLQSSLQNPKQIRLEYVLELARDEMSLFISVNRGLDTVSLQVTLLLGRSIVFNERRALVIPSKLILCTCSIHLLRVHYLCANG
jgi:hypothetical protein